MNHLHVRVLAQDLAGEERRAATPAEEKLSLPGAPRHRDELLQRLGGEIGRHDHDHRHGRDLLTPAKSFTGSNWRFLL